MTTSVRLPDSVEMKLSAYCEAHGISKGEAVKRALDSFLATEDRPTPYQLGQAGFGADQTHSGDIARHTKRLLREKFRGGADDC